MSQPDYNKAFQDGVGIEYTLQNEVGTVAEHYMLRLHRVGELVLTSGRILACDPMFMFETPPIADTVPPGRYPVILSVAELPSGDQRVACALLRLSEHAAVRWEIAAPQGQTLSALTPAKAFGYSVDFATGCFMDAAVPPELVAQETARTDVTDEGDPFYDRLDDMLDKTYLPTWSWADLIVDETTGANIIAFSSGWGDGCYPSYWGYDAANQRVALVTDFGVLNASWLAR
ncbi:MAG TPA: DUF4241 domain-containing protein [Ktedonobacterales bacterium]